MLKGDDRINFCHLNVVGFTLIKAFVQSSSLFCLLSSISIALQSLDLQQNKWMDAMIDEIKSLHENDTN